MSISNVRGCGGASILVSKYCDRQTMAFILPKGAVLVCWRNQDTQTLPMPLSLFALRVRCSDHARDVFAQQARRRRLAAAVVL